MTTRSSHTASEQVGSDTLIEFKQVSKHYGALRANDCVNFAITKGSIHALVGENGAGKSTAMKLLFGMETLTSGQILVRGQSRVYRSPRQAISDGIGMVHQHFMLSPVHSALDNIMLSRTTSKSLTRFLPHPMRALDREKVKRELEILSRSVGFDIAWQRPAGDLAVGVQQQIEIMKLLYAGVEIMIFDEPTAVLSPPEIESFLEMLRTLKNKGKTVVVITHKLKEVLAVSDYVTVMRGGCSIETGSTHSYSVQSLADLMVGRSVKLASNIGREEFRSGDVRLSLKDVSVRGHTKKTLSRISFELRAGEILGVAGVEGNGQSELLKLLYDPSLGGCFFESPQSHFKIMNQEAQGFRSLEVRSLGVGVVGADRHHESVLLTESLVENNALGYLKEVSNRGWINRTALYAKTKGLIDTYAVRPKDPETLMAHLSGGNQQKFVMGREISRRPPVLLCAEPTRGVDVGSIEQIHAELLNCRRNETAILLVSSQLDELMQLSDRIMVMSGGQIVKIYKRFEFDEGRIGRSMMGVI